MATTAESATIEQGSVVSADGTEIVYDRRRGGGAGTVIQIGGAFSYRKFPKMAQLAEALVRDHGLTVLTYDRRGRGDSGDTPGVYDVRREIDDLVALAEAEGGPDNEVSLFGWSSGAALALLAAAGGRLPGLVRVVAFEPPFVVDDEHHVPPADLQTRLHALIDAGRRDETVRYFMTRGMGVPSFVVAAMRFTPFWPKLRATAPATAHDWAVMAPYMRGEPLRPEDWAGVTAPTLVISGEKSAPLLRKGSRAIAGLLPAAEHRMLTGLSHNPKVGLLAPEVGEFLVGR
ncbi:alpha/beta hydrolase [Streptomyces sp. RKND-216]|uniref:alpha/beta fold hydrolase n=1 Tax=Streptomyces sp. RKND-216 TaxID=2562581 RepID=UPI00109DAE82|nr:alpha/beta hydrolase [Streptomyces sp. RKND-216]THA24685.1 alpha/beta hydrolase [Streptomyces sp. RKND-216]